MNFKLVYFAFAAFVAMGGAAFGQTCPGCEGDSDDDNDSAANCGSIAISVLVTPGECMYMINTETGSIGCQMTTKCLATITRAWNNVSAGTAMNFCISEGGITRCVQPPPNSGSGTGASVNSWQLSCGDGFTWSFTMPCPSGASLSVSAGGECTQCGL